MTRKERSNSQTTTLDRDAALHERIRELVINARRSVARGVDLVQVWTNFEIGRHIVEHEQQGEVRAGYGQVIVKNLAEKLTAEFGRGFSKSNLEYMRRFFLAYRERVLARITQSHTGQSVGVLRDEAPIAQFETGQLVAPVPQFRPFRLGWTYYVFLLGIQNPDERSFYEIEAAHQGWNLNELKRQFDSSLYERLALSRDKEGIRKLAKEGQAIAKPEDLLKQKNRTLVEITLPKGANIHAREYRLYLPSKEELRRRLKEWAAEVGNE
jgi:hypothetical protein